MTELFILAGGKGTRFFPFTAFFPKCLVPVAGKPCVRWIIEDAIEQGCFHSIVVCINEKDEQLFKHELRDLELSLSVTEEPKGTVNELLHALPTTDENFVLRYGDDLTEVDYESLIKFHKHTKATATLVTTPEVELSFGIVLMLDATKIFKFIEKPTLGKPCWAAVACFNFKRTLPYLKGSKDFALDVFPKMLSANEPVYAFKTISKWFDIGNIEHWRKADEYFRKKGSA